MRCPTSGRTARHLHPRHLASIARAAAEPDTLRYRLLSLPARLVRHARARVLKISRTWPWKEAFLACWQRLCALPVPA